MKVMQMVDSLSIGGTERMSVNIANALSDAQIANTLLVSREGHELAGFMNNPGNISYLSKRSRFDLKTFLKVNRSIKSSRPDVLHCHSSSVYWGALLKMLNPQLKLIFHDHYGLNEGMKPGDRPLLRFISGQIDGVIAVNDKLMNWAHQAMKTKADNIIQLDNFPYLPEVKANKPATKTIVHLANFRPQKDHKTLIEAIRLLVQKTGSTGQQLQVLLVGDDNIDAAYTQLIKDCISSSDLREIISITGPRNDVAHILAKAHLGVLSSVSEGLPVSVLEYGLSGLPVVCTNVGQCSKLLKAGDLGWLVPPGNAVELSKAIGEALDTSTQAKANRFATQFQQYVKSHFGPESFVEKYQSFISTL
jgi:glycosyltransferase involved in cell wall biosynthesis